MTDDPEPLPWHFREDVYGETWIHFEDGQRVCLGPVEQACEAMARYLEQRDFGEGQGS